MLSLCTKYDHDSLCTDTRQTTKFRYFSDLDKDVVHPETNEQVLYSRIPRGISVYVFRFNLTVIVQPSTVVFGTTSQLDAIGRDVDRSATQRA